MRAIKRAGVRVCACVAGRIERCCISAYRWPREFATLEIQEEGERGGEFIYCLVDESAYSAVIETMIYSRVASANRE